MLDVHILFHPFKTGREYDQPDLALAVTPLLRTCCLRRSEKS